MEIMIFYLVFILLVGFMLGRGIAYKIKDHKTDEEWKQIKDQNYSKMETTSKQDLSDKKTRVITQSGQST